MTPGAVDANAALQYRAAAAAASQSRSKLMIPLSGTTQGSGVSIPL